MALKPVPESLRAAFNLRRIAKEMVKQAEALEASAPEYKCPRDVEFLFSSKKRKEMA